MTGQICSTTGEYEFDGYTDATSLPPLSDDERHIAVGAGKPFPSASPIAKNAYWKFLGWS
jgi:hypothetical protein